MGNKDLKRCSKLIAFRKIQIKTTVRYYFTTIKVATKKQPKTNKAIGNVERLVCSWGRMSSHYETQHGGSSKHSK